MMIPQKKNKKTTLNSNVKCSNNAFYKYTIQFISTSALRLRPGRVSLPNPYIIIKVLNQFCY